MTTISSAKNFSEKDWKSFAKNITLEAANIPNSLCTSKTKKAFRDLALLLCKQGKGYFKATPTELVAMYPELYKKSSTIIWAIRDDTKDQKYIWAIATESVSSNGKIKTTDFFFCPVRPTN